MPQSNQKRDRLTQAARQLIHRAGFEHTTLADIARVAEVPLGNVYYYFKTKDALAQAVIENQAREFDQLVSELERLAEPLARIEGFLSMLVLESESIAAHGCPVGGLCADLNKSHSPLSEQATDLLRTRLAWLSEQFYQCGREEEAQELAQQLLIQVQGAAALAHAFNDPALYTRQIADLRRRLTAL